MADHQVLSNYIFLRFYILLVVSIVSVDSLPIPIPIPIPGVSQQAPLSVLRGGSATSPIYISSGESYSSSSGESDSSAGPYVSLLSYSLVISIIIVDSRLNLVVSQTYSHR